MKGLLLFPAVVVLCLALGGCRERNSETDTEISRGISNGFTYNIIIVMDTVDDWSSGIRDGFKDNIIKQLNGAGAAAEFTEYDTMLDPDRAAEIVSEIRKAEPDLICMINYPTVFADTFIASKLTGPSFKIVSENCMPVRSGVIESWDNPGGNITGVGVFVQMNSPIRLAKKIDPSLDKLVFYSWDQVKLLNNWFKEEITRACKEENVTLLEFREVSSQEETFRFFQKYNLRKDVFVMGGVSSFVHEDGTPANDRDEVAYTVNKTRLPFVIYDETAVQYGMLGGVCVIWYDIGAQLAEKGIQILEGEDPGSIPWDYPRKYNIVLNKKRGDKLGIEFKQEIISAAYRIYTDYDGNYIGKEN